jgi:hypothetical protein
MDIHIYITYFTLRVKAKVQFKLSIHVGAFIEISPKGFTLKVKVETLKKTCNPTLYGVVLAPRVEIDTYQLGRPICNSWSQCYNNKLNFLMKSTLYDQTKP